MAWNVNSQLELPGGAKARAEQLMVPLTWEPWISKGCSTPGSSQLPGAVCEAGRFRSTEHPVTERKGGVQTSAKTEILAKFIKFS